ncbi:MAG: zinc carboxypeptidase [Candidatus Sericytochromatia bacterium]|nr:zinc carboxypeptidase [Candidatus Sericytochromatia bacterium]
MNLKTLQPPGVFSVALATTLLVLSGCNAVQERPLMPGGNSAVDAQSWANLTFGTTSERKPVTLGYGNAAALTKMVEAGMDVWSVDVKAKKAEGTLTEAQALIAKNYGMSVAERPSGVMRMRADAGYRNYDQILARLRVLASQGAAFGAELVDIGDSWEKTQGKANRDIWALHFSKGQGKPIVTFAGCHHAREIATPEMVLKMAEHLVENYGKDAEVTADVDNRDIWIVPLVNPDGHVLAVAGKDQRKNANVKTGGKSRIGVDLNRNYATAWGTVGDSANPESDVFRGASAFSEPETQAVRDLLTKHPPVIYLTYHAYSNAVMWPWDHKNAAPPEPKLAALGNQLGKLSGYEPYQGAEMYLNGGDDVDWVYDKFKTLSYTVEVGGSGDGFMPPSSRLPKFWNENRPMMLHALKVADNPGAVFGPAMTVQTNRSGMSVSAPGAVKAEYFVGKPGIAGRGLPIALTGTSAEMGIESATKQLVFVHAQDAKGIWGPFETIWSK